MRQKVGATTSRCGTRRRRANAGRETCRSCRARFRSAAHRSPLNPTEYLRGLLPEGEHLQYLAARAKVPSNDLYSLLARYGRDVADAVVVSANEQDERAGGAIAYDSASLADEVAGLDERPLALYDDSELSIPGLQNKLLLIRTDTGWARPAGGRPSTHILKVEDRRFPGLVALEHAAMTVAHRLGLTTAETEIINLGGIDRIIVSRFDRIVDGGGQLCRAIRKTSVKRPV